MMMTVTKELNSKQIIRNFNLYLLSDIELEEPFLSIYNELKEMFSNLKMYKPSKGSNLYYGKAKNDLFIYIEINSGDSYIYFSDDKLGPSFEIKYGISFDDIKTITHWYITNILDFEIHGRIVGYFNMENSFLDTLCLVEV